MYLLESNFLIFTFILYSISIISLCFYNNNVIIMLISLEISIFAVSLQFIAHSLTFNDAIGLIFSLFSLVVAGGDSAIGLSLSIMLYKLKNDLYLNYDEYYINV